MALRWDEVDILFDLGGDGMAVLLEGAEAPLVDFALDVGPVLERGIIAGGFGVENVAGWRDGEREVELVEAGGNAFSGDGAAVGF
jgi:hypothetical protein